MKNLNVTKRENVYQYRFEIEKVNGKRKFITKSGFKTKNEAYVEGQKIMNSYLNGNITKKSQMSYSEYLDYWMKEYFEINYKYSTAKRYKDSFENIKKRIRLSTITPYMLNQALLRLY